MKISISSYLHMQSKMNICFPSTQREEEKKHKTQLYNNDHAKILKTDLRRGQVVKIYNRLFTKVCLSCKHSQETDREGMTFM